MLINLLHFSTLITVHVFFRPLLILYY